MTFFAWPGLTSKNPVFITSVQGRNQNRVQQRAYRPITLISVMSLLSFFGDLLIAFGPAIVLLIFYVGRHASLIILTLAAAFLWLLSALLASLLWFAAVPIRSSQPWAIFTGVTMQELARWCFFLLLGKAERELEIIATHGPGSALNESVHAL